MTMKHTWNVRFCAAWRIIWKCLSGLSLSISGFRWQSVVSIFSFSPWPSHYSSSSSMPPLWISHLPLPPPFSLFCPSLFSPLFLSHRISLCRSRCRNSLLHINELLISKAKRRPASQPSCLLQPVVHFALSPALFLLCFLILFPTLAVRLYLHDEQTIDMPRCTGIFPENPET